MEVRALVSNPGISRVNSPQPQRSEDPSNNNNIPNYQRAQTSCCGSRPHTDVGRKI